MEYLVFQIESNVSKDNDVDQSVSDNASYKHGSTRICLIVA